MLIITYLHQKTLSAEEEDIYLLKHITIMAIPNTSINRARLPENPKVNNAGHSKNTKAANKYKTKNTQVCTSILT